MKKIESGNVNIVTFITKGDIGGAQIHVKDLSVALKKLGNNVTVVVGEDAELTAMLSAENISYRVIENLVREINPIKDFKALSEIRNLLRELKPDLVTLHSSKAGIIGRLAVYLEKIPSTFTVHGWAFTDGISPPKQILYSLIEKIASPLPTYLIAVSEHDRKIGIEKNVCKANNIKTVHNGCPDIQHQLLADTSKCPPKLIMVARFAEQKDHKTLIEALAQLKELPWELNLIGGDSGLLTSTIASIKQHKLDEKVRILEYPNDIGKLMADSQIFVLSTNWEGFPVSIIEAMRANIPVIATDVGGVSEAVIHNETGYLTHSKKDLVIALRSLITDSDKRIVMGNKARENYEKYFTLETQLQNTYSIYNKLLANKSKYPCS